jgi:cytochrome c oxidase subunit 3
MDIMAAEATARVLDRRPTPDLRAVRGFGSRPPGGGREPVVSNAQLGILVLLGAEAMLFFGMIGAYLVFRYGSPVWPPPGQPHLPLLVTWVNTTVLLASGYTMHRARSAARDGNGSLISYLATTAVLGVAFLLIQGSEWVRLVHHGLTLSSGTYGATFYTLIGLHGVHVVGAVVWLLAVTWFARSGRFTRGGHVAVDLCAMYWNFVLGLWLLLFVLVYLR